MNFDVSLINYKSADIKNNKHLTPIKKIVMRLGMHYALLFEI